jgi:hypothetical protein
MIGRWRIHGHAIVSADDRIADASGSTPAALRNEADWRRFQAALDRAAVTVLGRHGHDANPNDAGRNRLVLSGAARGIEQRNAAWWWNPAKVAPADALAAAAPGGGTAAIVGGRRVFDLFLDFGYDAFDLVRAKRIALPGGVPLFSGIGPDRSAEVLLGAHGLHRAATQVLDSAAGVTLSEWVAGS